MRIAIIDYGVGNLFSLKCSFSSIGADTAVTGDYKVIRQADRIVLPGVGAFADAAEKLRQTGLGDAVTEQCRSGKPVIGICLGMQLLFEKSFEYGIHTGLGLIRGDVVPLEGNIQEGLKIPHMGWNSLDFGERKHPLFDGLKSGDHVYFVHSYYAKTDTNNIIATTGYGCAITAAVAKDNVLGCQFHPEKSGKIGLKILENFCWGNLKC